MDPVSLSIRTPLTALSAHKKADRHANRPDDDYQYANNDNCAVAAAVAGLLAALFVKPLFDRSICRCGCHMGDADPSPTQNRRTASY